jgi:predicted metalloprotease
MRFNRGARLDTSQVNDRRGRGGAVAVGGGGLGLLGILLVVVLNALGGGGGTTLPTAGVPAGTPVSSGQVGASCTTGEDANERQDCRMVAVVNSVQDYWDTEFTRRGWDYRPASTNFFEGSVNTGCGGASSAVGPFYCPADQQVYLDLGFFQELVTRFGASGGDFAEAYVIAHEYGHHVQNLLGISSEAQQARVQQGPTGASVRLELQADCFAGVWARHATTTVDQDNRALIEELTDADIREGLDAAAAVGDDRIQERARGRVDPESWTHGSAEQRQHWFRTGFQGGTADACDTFAAGASVGG